MSVIDLRGATAPAPPARASAPAGSRARRRPARRRPSGHGWATAGIGAATAGLYGWGLAGAGDLNTYYTAAVRSATVSWKALFFGSIDSASSITVDKPPAALWLQALSARALGFSTASLLLPEALCGVFTVLVLHRLVRRWAGDWAAHLAALAMAVTPVAALMFRFNNPDALLTALCVAAAWAVWNAVETGRTRHLLAAAVLLGLAFDTKMLQAFLVLPAFALTYLVAGPPRLGRRLVQLLAAGGALALASGWWVAVVALWPAASRPFIGSTQDGSVVSLVFGYNGLARILGRTAGNGGPGGGGPSGGSGFGGAAGWLRLFNGEIGGQISWLLPFATAGLAAGLWATRRRRRIDRARAGWILWGAWAATCVAIFSLSKGTFHAYYVVQLAPAVAALCGAGAVTLWRLGRSRWARWALPAAIVATGAWSVTLLARTPTWHPWLRPAVLAAAALGAAGIWAGWLLRHRLLASAAAGLAVIALLAGPAAYAVATVAAPHSGSIVLAGPTTGAGPGAGGGAATASNATLVRYLQANQGRATYLVATFGSQSAAPLILASDGDAVLAIGGFTGSDPYPTLPQLQQLVASGQLRYLYVGGGGMGGGPRGPGGGTSSAITTWAAGHGTVVDAAATGATGTLYDLGTPTA